MEKVIIARSTKIKNGLDDDYTLYDNGEILHEYDRHKYPGGYNLEEILTPEDLKDEVKERFLSAAREENKDLVREILGI